MNCQANLRKAAQHVRLCIQMSDTAPTDSAHEQRPRTRSSPCATGVRAGLEEPLDMHNITQYYYNITGPA